MGAAESSGMSVTAATTSLPPGSTQEDIDRAIENIRKILKIFISNPRLRVRVRVLVRIQGPQARARAVRARSSY